MEIGSCWGIAGPSGRLSVKFAQQIVADSITIDHIPAQIASDFSSAPNEFRVLVRGQAFVQQSVVASLLLLWRELIRVYSCFLGHLGSPSAGDSGFYILWQFLVRQQGLS